MIPFKLRAYIDGPIVLRGPIHLDALLGAAVAQEMGLAANGPIVDIALPLAESRGVWVATVADVYAETALKQRAHVQRRSVVEAAQDYGEDKLRRVNIASGANKMTRDPEERLILRGWLEWEGVGFPGLVLELAQSHLTVGHRRGTGHGVVVRWEIEETSQEPALVDGDRVRRILPATWPDLPRGAQPSMKRVRPPYWRHEGAQMAVEPTVRWHDVSPP